MVEVVEDSVRSKREAPLEAPAAEEAKPVVKQSKKLKKAKALPVGEEPVKKSKSKKVKKNKNKGKKVEPVAEEGVVDAVTNLEVAPEEVSTAKKAEKKTAAKKSKRSVSEAELELPLSEKASKGKKKKAEEVGKKKKPVKTEKSKAEAVEQAEVPAEAPADAEVAAPALTGAKGPAGLAEEQEACANDQCANNEE